jgi:parallel beta-helix repeat protein
MKNIFWFLIIGLFGLTGCSTGPQPIEYGKAECSFCKMTIMDKQFGCQVVNTKGKPFNFDDISCLLSSLGTTRPEEIGAIYVPDYSGTNLLPAADMHYVKSEELHSPMAGNTAAFSLEDSAQHYAGKLNGSMVAWKNLISKMSRLWFIIWFLASGLLAVAGSVTAGSKAFPTIKSAIAAAKDGDTVFVMAKTYGESPIMVNKRIVLMGLQTPVLDGNLKHEIMIIEADGAVIQGFHFRNSGFSGYEDVAGLRLMQCRDVIVRNNKFTNTFFGVYGQHAVNCIIQNNTFFSSALDETVSGNGIHCWKSDSMIIKGNRVQGHRDGIYFEFVTNSLIEGNTTTGNARYGLHFMFSNDDTYLNNEFNDNGAGVAVMYSKRVTMLHNKFLKNRGTSAYGILLKDISDSHIAGNLFEDNTVGIFMEGSSRIFLTQNQFTANGWAMRMQASCDDIKNEQEQL